MQVMFFALCALGLALLIILPHDKNRIKRLTQRGGAAVLFGLGLYGGLVTLIAG